MANAFPHKQVQSNGTHAAAHLSPGHDDNGATSVKGKPLVSRSLAYWGDAARGEPKHELGDEQVGDGSEGHGDPERVLAENAELHQALHELQQMLEEAGHREQGWNEQQREYESLLEEKSEVIRSLHQKVQELQERTQIAPVPREEELIALSDELDRERCRLQQERKAIEEESEQLHEDEQALMQQMREMEVQMSRERAELARQRNELQRLHADIRHELELAARDATLRERLVPLQRRHQDMLHRKGAAPSQPREQSAPAPEPEAAQPPRGEKGKDSGLFRRFFGSSGK